MEYDMNSETDLVRIDSLLDFFDFYFDYVHGDDGGDGDADCGYANVDDE